jgi:hypothetical protein
VCQRFGAAGALIGALDDDGLEDLAPGYAVPAVFLAELGSISSSLLVPLIALGLSY